MDMSNSIDKSWDHPWTTEEMRKKRREWSLAGDVGLLKHLQQFSENLVSKANKTQATLDTLATQLKETAILVDNVTNTSLALANTQFIESRVQEDDVELKENSEEGQQEAKPQDSTPENLIASISENVKQGLSIMDQKYKVMDVACSDSEEEDDGGAVVFSVIVRPNDPYQERPLPYVIGSDKWMASDKIGLESSSSESEQAEEEEEEEREEESESDDDEKKAAGVRKVVLNGRHNPEVKVARLSSSSDSDNYNDPDSNGPYLSNKTDTVSQNNINSASESATPNNISKTSSEVTPNFAEELAKRLGTVRQAQKPVSVDEAGESSINRFKDDLFASGRNDDAFNDGSDNLFGDEKGLFDDQVSAKLWKDGPIRPYKSSNIIPPSIDVPPPISIISTKPKSEIDDLFADADSEEDSDIFSSSKIIKERAKEPIASDNIYSPAGTEDVPKKLLSAKAPGVATSTPQININSLNLFSDDENDDSYLFSNPKKHSHAAANVSSSANATQQSNKKKPVGGVSMLGTVLVSDIESNLSSRMKQRRQESSESSDSEAPRNPDSATWSNNIETISATSSGFLNDAIARSSRISSAESPAQDNISITVDSSGISLPVSIDNTIGSSLTNFDPTMTSTRLKSEEMYRERITSDSLFAARTRNFVSSTNSNKQQPRQEQQDGSSALQDDVFENDDLFGPPPLPSKTDSKRATKSKFLSRFDDSDSGDELFSAASSGSRSQKSTDFFAATASNDKAKPPLKGSGLFDDDVDIFGGKDAPDVDIFGTASKSKSKDADELFGERGQDSTASKTPNVAVDQSQNAKVERKKISLFDDDDDDGDDLFSTKPAKSKSERRSNNLFEDEDDLFLSTKASNKGCGSAEKERASAEPKIDVSRNVSSLETEKRNKNSSISEGELFSETAETRGLFEDYDDYDDLFDKKVTAMRENDQSKPRPKQEVEKDMIEEAQKGPPEENENPIESSDGNDAVAANSEPNIPVNDSNEKCERLVKGTSANIEETDGATKKNSPPRTLDIHSITPPSTEELSNQQQVPRRSVSGKIKNLMGKMGDLKILSPMDAPPLWRKSDDKTDEDEDVLDSDSGGRNAGRISPPSVSEGSARKESSTISIASNAEAAISFDDLAQVETLSTTASKSRVRIQAKRRPQSRHARKSALRHSGIDFDTVDNAQDNSQEESHGSISSSAKDSFTAPASAADRLAISDNAHRSTVDPSSTDDRSELGSISKESSMSVNKNTLLSPSTDEEDLFDVPPDLPEDPQKEDALFGRAPILSPLDSGQSDKTPVAVESLTDTVLRKVDDDNDGSISDNKSNSQLTRSDIVESNASQSRERRNEQREEADNERSGAKEESSTEEPNDPLRDSSHDPLKDPSQLFAFVTKTPSPEKSKNLLFPEPDDSLFSSSAMRQSSEPRKKTLDLFADDDDVGGDLFSSVPSRKTIRKPLRDTKIGLFGDDDGAQDDEDDSLFGSISSKAKLDSQKSNLAPVCVGRKKNNIFDDDDDDDDSSLFVESSGQSQKSDSASFSEPKLDPQGDYQAKSSNLKSIFGDAPCDEEDDLDLFATRKVVPKKLAVPSKSLFSSDDNDDDGGDDGHIFGKQPIASRDSKARTDTVTTRPAVKKPVTRDLKKTAEKIIEDPLSLLQDD